MDSESVNLPACWNVLWPQSQYLQCFHGHLQMCRGAKNCIARPASSQLRLERWLDDFFFQFAHYKRVLFKVYLVLFFVLLIGGFAVLKWPPGSVLKLDSSFRVLERCNEPYIENRKRVLDKLHSGLTCSLVDHDFNSYESITYILKVALKKKHASNQVTYWSVGNRVVIRGSQEPRPCISPGATFHYLLTQCCWLVIAVHLERCHHTTLLGRPCCPAEGSMVNSFQLVAHPGPIMCFTFIFNKHLISQLLASPVAQ